MFWKNHDEDSIINDLPTGINFENSNALLITQKEVEKKFQDFFSFNTQEKIPFQNDVLKSKDIQKNSKYSDNELFKKTQRLHNLQKENGIIHLKLRNFSLNLF